MGNNNFDISIYQKNEMILSSNTNILQFQMNLNLPLASSDYAPLLLTAHYYDFYNFITIRNKLIELLDSSILLPTVAAQPIFNYELETAFNIDFYNEYIKQIKPATKDQSADKVTVSKLLPSKYHTESNSIPHSVRKSIREFLTKHSLNKNSSIVTSNNTFFIPLNTLPEYLLTFYYEYGPDYSNSQIASDRVERKPRARKPQSADSYIQVFHKTETSFSIPKLDFSEDDDVIVHAAIRIAHRLWLDKMFKFSELLVLNSYYSMLNSDNFRRYFFQCIKYNINNDQKRSSMIMDAFLNENFLSSGLNCMYSIYFIKLLFITFYQNSLFYQMQSISLEEALNDINANRIRLQNYLGESGPLLPTPYFSQNIYHADEALPTFSEPKTVREFLKALYNNPVFQALYIQPYNNMTHKMNTFPDHILSFGAFKNGISTL